MGCRGAATEAIAPELAPFALKRAESSQVYTDRLAKVGNRRDTSFYPDHQALVGTLYQDAGGPLGARVSAPARSHRSFCNSP